MGIVFFGTPKDGVAKNINIFTKFVEYGIMTNELRLRGVTITVGGLPFFYERAFVSALLVLHKGGR